MGKLQNFVDNTNAFAEKVGDDVKLLKQRQDDLIDDQQSSADSTYSSNHINLRLDDKVDKVPGKELSEENFTTELKDKLESLGNTSLFDDIFIYNETENPEQEFELSFVPYQIVSVLDNNQMKWLDDGDYEMNGNTLKMLYPLENGTKLRINYYHNL